MSNHLISQQRAWFDPESFGTTLLVLFLDNFGSEGLQWDPATIALEVEETFNVPLPAASFDRLMAAVRILTTDDFTTSLPDFIQCCNVLSGDIYDPNNWDPADSTEIAWGLTEGLLIDPPEDEEPFSEEIRAYIGAALDAEGIMKAPDILAIALRDDVKPLIQDDFTDDPTMFAAVYEAEASKTDDINRIIKENLRRLANQLEALPLQTGNAKDVFRALFQSAE